MLTLFARRSPSAPRNISAAFPKKVANSGILTGQSTPYVTLSSACVGPAFKTPSRCGLPLSGLLDHASRFSHADISAVDGLSTAIRSYKKKKCGRYSETAKGSLKG